MDKELLKKVLMESALSEAKPVGLAITDKVKAKDKKENDDYYKEVAKKMEDYEKASTSSTEDAIEEPKFNYDYENEVEYHEDMEIRNGMEMLNYDRKPSEKFSQRAKEAIEGSNNMGNNPEWANVVPKQQGFTGPEFGKDLVSKIERSKKKRDAASELSNKNTTSVNATDFKDSAMTNKKAKSIAISEDNTNNKSEIKETTKMKRLKFKKAFNGIETALNVIPESYKVDNKVFEMTDGNEHYKIRWEGSLNEGTAIVLNAYDDNLVKEDFDKIKHLMNFKSQDTLGNLKGSQRLDENQAFADMIKKTRTIMTEGEGAEHPLASRDKCTNCNGSGTAMRDGGDRCTVCNGTGETAEGAEHPLASGDKCTNCNGSGTAMRDGGDRCTVCNGTGEIAEGAEHLQELSPETYDKVRDAGLERGDRKGAALADTANELKYKPVIGKEVKYLPTDGLGRGGKVDQIKEFGKHVDVVIIDGNNAEVIKIFKDSNDVKVQGLRTEVDRPTANVLAKVKELAFGVESKANDFKQLAETDKPDFLDLDGDGNTEEAMKDAAKKKTLDETEFELSEDRYNGKFDEIMSDLKSVRGGLDNGAPKVFVKDNLIHVSAEDGQYFADYYGEYSGGYPKIDDSLEDLADKYDCYWEWEDAGAIILAPDF